MLAVVAALALPVGFDMDLRTGSGMTLKLSGVPIVRGTWFQYFEADYSKGLYSSMVNVQQIERRENGFRLSFRSPDSRAYGTQTYVRQDNRLKVSYEFNWSGDRPVKVEVAAGLLWARAFQGGSLVLDQRPTRSLAPQDYGETGEIGPRLYGSNFGEAVFQGALGRMAVRTSQPGLTLFDGRGYKQAWAEGRDLLWLGHRGIDVRPGSTTRFDVEYEISPTSVEPRVATREATASELTTARLVRQDQPPIIPKPKQAFFDRESRFPIGNELRVDIPSALSPMKQELLRAFKRWWIVPQLRISETNDPNIYFRIENIGLPPEGFEIRINPKTVIVWGQDEAGLRYGLHTLAALAFAKDGSLWFPSGTLRDWPSVGWRGVHLFGGHELRTFHPTLIERVLVPLRFNRVLLQCERTQWDSLPKIHAPNWNTKEDLAFAFDAYRKFGIEPIPLIQSLGHMEWFFNNGQNLQFAVNPLVPYTVDFRKPGAKDTIMALWREAIELLKPKTVHFGLDEIANRGMRKIPSETTMIWEAAAPIWSDIALRFGVTPMFWGDMGLTVGQAIDAAHGDDPTNARRRRDALPRGAMIADWHYKNDMRPERFQTSLNLWKEEGFQPIASGWFNPDNIAGFTQAAYRTNAGYLQTTWAGYETTEENVFREMRQFAAWVLAADYAWSARVDNPRELEYDPREVFARLLYGEPSPLSPASGTTLNGPRLVRIGDIGFKVGEPYALMSLLQPGGSNLPSQIDIKTTGLKGQTLVLAMDCVQPCEERDPVGDVEVEFEDGRTVDKRLLYGLHVRASIDRRNVGAGLKGEGLAAIQIPLGKLHEVKRITIRAASTYAGLRLHGATAY